MSRNLEETEKSLAEQKQEAHGMKTNLKKYKELSQSKSLFGTLTLVQSGHMVYLVLLTSIFHAQ